jgi:hypothetical protein
LLPFFPAQCGSFPPLPEPSALNQFNWIPVGFIIYRKTGNPQGLEKALPVPESEVSVDGA